MNSGPMTPCPAGSELMKAWTAYQETDDFKNSAYWATTETQMRQERAEEIGMHPLANKVTPEMRADRVKGSLWAAFMAGFGAAGGKVNF